METLKQTIDKKEIEVYRKEDVEKEIITISNDLQTVISQAQEKEASALAIVHKCAVILEDALEKIHSEIGTF